MTEKKIGKIQSVKFGHCGYQDSCIGIDFSFGSDKDCWGVCQNWGDWCFERSEHAKWTEESRIKNLGEMCMKIAKLLEEAKVDDIAELKGVPVEVTFAGNVIKSWRILTEVI